MCSVDDNGIHTSLHQCFHALEGVSCNAHSCCHAQATFFVLASHWLIFCLCDVLVGNQAYQMIFFIHHWQLLNLMLHQDARRIVEVSLLMGDNQILTGHHMVNQFVQIGLETKVTIRHDTYQLIIIIHNRDTTNMKFRHHAECILHRRATLDGHRVVNHTILSTFHDSHLTGLFLYTHILVNHTDSTFSCNSNSHSSLSHSVHSSCDKRNFQIDVTGEFC